MSEFTWVVSINMFEKRRFLIPEGLLFHRQRFNEICCLEDKTSLTKLGKKMKLLSPLEDFVWDTSVRCANLIRYLLCNLRSKNDVVCPVQEGHGSFDSFLLQKSSNFAIPRWTVRGMEWCGLSVLWIAGASCSMGWLYFLWTWHDEERRFHSVKSSTLGFCAESGIAGGAR